MTVLDFIRYHKHLMGTKIGCREGDCGACTILIGNLKNGQLKYESVTSCLMPLGNAHNKHIVTIEGINPAGAGQNMQELNPIQKAMADEGATQCGFCTPGFVISLAGFCLSGKESTSQNAVAAIDGNICRCTGYKSIQRATEKIAYMMQERKNEEPANFVAKKNILPHYFTTIKERLQILISKTNGVLNKHKNTFFLSGGTDLYVQKHDEIKEADIQFLFDRPQLNGISRKGNKCILGGSVTVTDLLESTLMQQYFPGLSRYIKLISSTPIRNMATIAGNFINASPIGDFTIFFLSLNAQLILSDGKSSRKLPLRKLFKGYKTLDKKPEEYIEKIWIELPGKNTFFNFEKVSKRTHLDIASVNTAISITMNNETVIEARLAAGGVGPIPLFLEKSSGYLKGKIISEELVYELIEIVQTEISPISDARGSEDYKR